MPDLYPARTTDEELFRAIATGGQLGAWKMLYDRHSEPIGGYALRILRSGRCYDPGDHVKDVRQETWFRVARAIHQCNESPVGWLYRIARNASRDHLRGCGRAMADDEQWPDSPAAEERLLSPPGRLYSHEELFLRRLALRQAISRLSHEEQLVLRLRCDGLGYEEISRITGHSAVNARKIFQRAKQRVRTVGAEEVR
jgi:RNA polymerase sigma factor (sigma-70 family)